MNESEPSKAICDWQIKTFERPIYEAFLKSQGINPKKHPEPVFERYDTFTDDPDTAHASKTMLLGVAILAVLTILGDVYLIYVGETTQWATAQTKASPPSIEIVP